MSEVTPGSLRGFQDAQGLLDASVPLEPGLLWIEASAGTGKSYTLVRLYLRWLLGLGTGRPPLPVSKILVLSFTVKATRELRERLREAMTQLQAALMDPEGESASNKALGKVLLEAKKQPGAVEWLQAAKQQLEVAPVYTLHGFCGRVLRRWAFASGLPSPPGQVVDAQAYLWSAATQFWNERLFHPNRLWREALLLVYPEVEALYSALQKLFDRDQVVIDGAFGDEDAFLRAYRAHRSGLKRLRARFEALDPEDWFRTVKKVKGSSRFWAGALERLRAWWADAEGTLEPYTLELLQKVLQHTSDAVLEQASKETRSWLESARQRVEGWVSPEPTLLLSAWEHLRHRMPRWAWESGWVTFQDLVGELERVLLGEEGQRLAKEIRQAYPAALVDEFQDTDARQYRILSALYRSDLQSGSQLVLIGDPKQAIYGFRGGDLATYLTAARSASARYRLQVNWRASYELLQTLNGLWGRVPAPFGTAEVPFVPCRSAFQPGHFQLHFEGRPLPALRVYTPHPGLLSQTEYRRLSATACAREVACWMKAIQAGTVQLEGRGGGRRVRPKDLAVLVRNHLEARAISEALRALGVESLYSSNQGTRFQVPGAVRLARILRVVWSGGALRALIPDVMSQAQALEAPHWSERRWQAWESQMEQAFCEVRANWLRQGLLPAMLGWLNQSGVVAHWRHEERGMERLEGFYQALARLAELEAEGKWRDPGEMVDWLVVQTQPPSLGEAREPFKPVRPPDAVELVSIYKAKGLEYVAVWIPFACSIPRASQVVYRPSLLDCVHWHPNPDESIQEKRQQEQFSEEMRLFYVASTRATHYLSLGVSPVRSGSIRNRSLPSHVHRTGFGALLQQGHERDSAGFFQMLSTWVEATEGVEWVKWPGPAEQEGGGLEPVEDFRAHPATPEAVEPPSMLLPRRAPFGAWKIQSYTRLTQAPSPAQRGNLAGVSALGVAPGPDELGAEARLVQALAGDVEEPAVPRSGSNGELPALSERVGFSEPSVGTTKSRESGRSDDPALLEVGDAGRFPRGSGPGSCLHAILERWDGRSPLAESDLKASLLAYRLDPRWAAWLQHWFPVVAAHPLLATGVALRDLDLGEMCAEMPFLIRTKCAVSAKRLVACLRLDPVLASAPLELNFTPFFGGVQGLIDLTFRWEGRYYLLDYKSNWLGPAVEDYGAPALQASMWEHRYPVQYVLYTLALHRYLRQRLADHYDYERDFGGAIYYFLRGAGGPGGVFTSRPAQSAIEALDRMFEGVSTDADWARGDGA